MIENFIITSITTLYTITGSLGLAIIVFTLIVKTLLLPVVLPSLRVGREMKKIQPELAKLKKKYTDKKELQKAQVELYQKYNVNPLAGCIPQVIQIGMVIVLYRALVHFLENPTVNGVVIDTMYYGFDLTLPDTTYVLPVLAALSQLVLSLMIAPGAEKRDIVPNNSSKKAIQEENKKEENIAEMAQQMQQQMMYIMPIMTGFIATRFPSGLALYWVVSTLYSIVQQYIIAGPGGLTKYLPKGLRRS